MLIRLHARAVLRVNGTPDATPLQDFANEIDALLSYDSVHYQDYSVNRAPIQRAFRAYFYLSKTDTHPQSAQSDGP